MGISNPVNTIMALPVPCLGYEVVADCPFPNIIHCQDSFYIPNMRAIYIRSYQCLDCDFYLSMEQLEETLKLEEIQIENEPFFRKILKVLKAQE